MRRNPIEVAVARSKHALALVRVVTTGLILTKLQDGVMLVLVVSALTGAAGWCASSQLAFSRQGSEREAKATTSVESKAKSPPPPRMGMHTAMASRGSCRSLGDGAVPARD